MRRWPFSVHSQALVLPKRKLVMCRQHLTKDRNRTHSFFPNASHHLRNNKVFWPNESQCDFLFDFFSSFQLFVRKSSLPTPIHKAHTFTINYHHTIFSTSAFFLSFTFHYNNYSQIVVESSSIFAVCFDSKSFLCFV